MPTFTTDFAPPAAPTDLDLVANVAASAIDLSWTATSLGVDFVNYRVYRSLDGGLTYTLLATLTIEAQSLYSDYLAPLDVTLTYRVTVSNPDFESAPVVGASELDVGEWWIVRPGDLGLTFQLRHVSGADDVTPRPSEQYIALGRPRKLVISGQQLGHEGMISAVITPADRGLVTLLRAAADLTDEWILLKTPFSEVFRVRLSDVRRGRGQAGHQTVELPFVEVS